MDWIKCIRNRLLRAARREAGVTLIETVFAIAIFGMVSTALIGVLTSATAADGLARQRSIALELAQQQIEYIRQLNYRDAGIAEGNPGGVVQATQTKWVTGLRYTLTTRIKYVNDPIPASYIASANYKQVRVVVARASDGKELARVSTYLSSPTRLYSGGLNNGLINVTTQDYVTLEPLGGAQIHLSKTWDASFSAGDITDTATGTPAFGQVTFAGLEETPTDATPGYYDVEASLANYVVLRDDQPPDDPTDPASAAHLALARNGTTNTTIRLYRPCTIDVQVKDENTGEDYTGTATVTISSPRGSEQFSADSAGHVSTDTIDGDPIVPGDDYAIDVDTPDYRHGQATGLAVPDSYPNDLSSSFDVWLGGVVPPEPATLTITVRRYSCYGNTVSHATVRIVWLINPSDPTHNFTATTNWQGRVVITGVPLDTYDIRAQRSSWHSTLYGALPDQQVTGNASYCVPIS